MSQPLSDGEQRTLFVYYKVPIEERAAAVAAAHDLIGQLATALPEVHVELMQRPEPSKGVETWMEVYRADAGVTQALEQQIEMVLESVPAFRQWPRAREIFIPLRMQ